MYIYIAWIVFPQSKYSITELYVIGNGTGKYIFAIPAFLPIEKKFKIVKIQSMLHLAATEICLFAFFISFEFFAQVTCSLLEIQKGNNIFFFSVPCHIYPC